MKNDRTKYSEEMLENERKEDLQDDMSPEMIEIYKRALAEVYEEEFDKLNELASNSEIPAPSRRHMIRMNRLFRERVGGAYERGAQYCGEFSYQGYI